MHTSVKRCECGLSGHPGQRVDESDDGYGVVQTVDHEYSNETELRSC